MRMRWRHLFRVIHRDIGYCAVALTIAYALSGIAVNHIDDWNPNYTFHERAVDIGPVPAGPLAQRGTHVVDRLALDPNTVRAQVMETEHELRVFFDDGAEVHLDTRTGTGKHLVVERRLVFFEVNELHLNNLKGIWTWVADIFALALMILALTGMTMMKGDRGLSGRGKYFVLGGLAIPVGFVIYMYA
jgi:hypothetical protein